MRNIELGTPGGEAWESEFFDVDWEELPASVIRLGNSIEPANDADRERLDTWRRFKVGDLHFRTYIRVGVGYLEVTDEPDPRLTRRIRTLWDEGLHENEILVRMQAWRPAAYEAGLVDEAMAKELGGAR